MELVKGFIIPKEGPTFARRIKKEEFPTFLNNFKELFLRALHFYLKSRKGDIKRLIYSAEIDDFLNFFIAYYKSLIEVDVVPEIMTPNLKMVVLYLLFKEEVGEIEEVVELQKVIKRLLEKYQEISTEFNKLYSEEMREKALDIFEFPADTRPGSNISSLILHSFTTSALASSISFKRKDRAAIRLAALFHDIGKFVEWKKHMQKSKEILGDLMMDYCDGEALKVLNDALELVGKSHMEEGDERIKILRDADQNASGLDRLLELFFLLLEEDDDAYREFTSRLGDIGDWEKMKKKLRLSHEPWERFSEDEITKYSEFFCKKCGVVQGEKSIIKKLERLQVKSGLANVYLVRFDVRGIQRFIKSEIIRVMTAGSRIVDGVIFLYIPSLLLRKYSLPLECILFSGGGNLTVVMPDHVYGQVSSDDEITNPLKTLTLTIEGTPYRPSYWRMMDEIDTLIFRRKMEASSSQVHPNIFRPCDSCKREVATEKEERPYASPLYLCKTCYEKYKYGEGLHFAPRLTRLGVTIDEKRLERILEHILEYIAGHSLDEAEKGEFREYETLALVKVDGNFTGAFMASALSLTDATERSIKIDSSLKLAFKEFLQRLKEEDKRRVLLGLLYVGGDDAALLMPSTLTFKFFWEVSQYYSRAMGYKHALSMGIAASKPKHPIIPLYEGADALLKIAKKKFRDEMWRIMGVEEPDGRFRGAVAFFEAERGVITDVEVKSATDELRKEGLSNQPYSLCDQKDPSSILRLINCIPGISLSQNDIVFPTNNSLKENLRETRKVILNTLSVNIQGRSSISIKMIFMTKESAEISKNVVKNLFIRSDKRYLFPLQDLYHMIKIIGGKNV